MQLVRSLLLLSSVLVELIRHMIVCMNHRNAGTLFWCSIYDVSLILDLIDLRNVVWLQ
jgi:hypothetical protein